MLASNNNNNNTNSNAVLAKRHQVCATQVNCLQDPACLLVQEHRSDSPAAYSPDTGQQRQVVTTREYSQTRMCLLICARNMSDSRQQAKLDQSRMMRAMCSMPNPPGSADVAPTGPEGLGEGAHHHIHISWQDPKVLTHPAPLLPHGTYAVSLIQEQICLFTAMQYLSA